jgi:hypothetical protein
MASPRARPMILRRMDARGGSPGHQGDGAEHQGGARFLRSRNPRTHQTRQNPHGIQIVLVEVPADHPLRRDPAIGVTTKVTSSMRLMRAMMGLWTRR